MNSIAEVQVSYNPEKTIDFKLENSRSSFQLLLKSWDEGRIEMQEEVKVLLLNTSNKVLGIYSLAQGGISGCHVDIRLILAVALKSVASGLILVHNHPSGSIRPSDIDKRITEKLKLACQLVDIKLLDHLIITKNDYFSFADEEIL